VLYNKDDFYKGKCLRQCRVDDYIILIIINNIKK